MHGALGFPQDVSVRAASSHRRAKMCAAVFSEYAVPRQLAFFWTLVGKEPILHMEPFLIHTVVLALFASLIAPFGGFFASGFKRAFKIKDFGDVIPGHGGLMDRWVLRRDSRLLKIGCCKRGQFSERVASNDRNSCRRRLLACRFDCQLLMGSFTYAYMHSLIR